MKCSLCGKEMEQIFLGKLIGTYVKDEKGKKKPVCNECQKTKSMAEIKEEL